MSFLSFSIAPGRPDHFGRFGSSQPTFTRRRPWRQQDFDDRVAQTLFAMMVDCCPEIF
jgi:hypothetical protein